MSALQVFLDWVNVAADFFTVVMLLDVVALFILLFLEKYDPRTFLAWLILLTFLPPVGIILYMYMGMALYRKRHMIPKSVTDRQMMDGYEFFKGILDGDEGRLGRTESVRMARILESAGGWGYTNDNDVTLYTEGKPMMDDMFDSFRRAERSILIEYYIIRNDRRGNEMMDILTEKVREGVEVRLLTDAFGIGKGPKDGIRRFVQAGGHYATFHSMMTLLFSPKKNNRNHRKIAIIDGEEAYCGGFNVGDEYEGEGPLGHWRDASVRVRGTGIVPLAIRFAVDWQYAKKRDRLGPVEDYIDMDSLGGKGDVRMQVVSGGPDTMPSNPVQMQYLSMIANAKERLYITTPYLVPDDAMMVALQNAARSGVDVRILIPDKPDHMFMFWNNQTFANELMKAGVRVFRYNDGFIHEKVIVMDGECLSVGSANLDNRSLTLNFETNVMIYDGELTSQAADRFLRDLEVSTEYSCEEFDRRTTEMRIRMAISRMFKLLA